MTYTDSFINTKGEEINLKLRFHRESRMTYRIQSVDDLFSDNYKLLIQLITHHQEKQVPRIQELYDYAEGNNHEVLKHEFRRNETDMADNRAVHNFGRKISVFRQGYLVGNPVQVDYADGKKKSPTDLALHYLNQVNNFDDLNRQLVLDLSQVGRAYEIAYYTEDGKLKFSRLDPLTTFVIYDHTIDQNQLAGVRYYAPNMFNEEEILIELYTAESRYYIIWNKDEVREAEVPVEANGFEDVQITEYLNNEQGIGDYETELPLIDLYDAAQSDTANYMTDLADAILVIYGDIDFPPEIDTPEKQVEYMKEMRKARLMQLVPPQDYEGKERPVNAEYLYKKYDVSGTEAYKTRLHDDIHEFTSTPNLGDENFSGTQSGEAMKYKLFGLDQQRVSTQALFEKGLRRRYKLLANIYPQISTGELEEFNGAFSDFDESKLKIKFTPNLPHSDNEVVEMVQKLWGLISDETRLDLLEVVTDISAEDEKNRIKKENGDTDLRPEPRINEGEEDEA